MTLFLTILSILLVFETTVTNAVVCPREEGFCVLPNGADQNSGVIKLNNKNINNEKLKNECLALCRKNPRATGCEVIWDQSNRGCYVHTQDVVMGNGAARHNCWVFSCRPGDFEGYRFISKNFPAFHIGVKGNAAFILRGNGQRFRIVQALTGRLDAVSFESTSKPGYFLRHSGWLLYLQKKQNDGLYKKDASFYIRNNKFFSGYAAFESCNYPGHFLRHQNYRLKLNKFANRILFKNDASFKLASIVTKAVYPREEGFCVLPNGADQNSGVIKLNNKNINNEILKNECLVLCRKNPRATGCEVIWDQSNRGCYVHTQDVAMGNGAARHNCWVFSCRPVKKAVCPREKGFCVLPNGDDQNSGVIKLNNKNINNEVLKNECLVLCRKNPNATGCEVIWDQSNRGCYVHTQAVAWGNRVARHNCWIFSC